MTIIDVGLLIVGITLLAMAFYIWRKDKKDDTPPRQEETKTYSEQQTQIPKQETEEIKEETNKRIDWSQSYQPRYLLTKNEWYAYKRLKEIADIRGFIICPKVRLLDIIEPRRGTNNYMSSLGKIQSKHVDFLICDKNLYIKAILELDDNSHNTAERQERDSFVNEVLQSVGYKVIHTRGITDNILDEI